MLTVAVFCRDDGIIDGQQKQFLKDVLPELSNSGSPPAEPGVYLKENYSSSIIYY
jgi:hypothetical protein